MDYVTIYIYQVLRILEKNGKMALLEKTGLSSEETAALKKWFDSPLKRPDHKQKEAIQTLYLYLKYR